MSVEVELTACAVLESTAQHVKACMFCTHQLTDSDDLVTVDRPQPLTVCVQRCAVIKVTT